MRLAPKDGEKIRMFAADTQGFRDEFSHARSCDALFLVETGDGRTLLFVELKGRRFEDAAEQLAATLLAVRSKLPADCRQSTVLQALAVTAGGTPAMETRKAQESFHRRTGVRLQRRSLSPGNTLDLREHITTAGARKD